LQGNVNNNFNKNPFAVYNLPKAMQYILRKLNSHISLNAKLLSEIVQNKLNASVILFFITIGATLFLYRSFLPDLSLVGRYWDGPNYMYIAKTLYNIPTEHPLSYLHMPSYYYSSHLPLFPLLIKAINLLGFDYFHAMLLAILLASGFMSVALYLFFAETGYVKQPFWSTLILIFFPARMLLYRSVGATEPLFIGLVALSLLFFKKENYLLAFFLAAMASITRVVGVFLLAPFFIVLVQKKQFQKIFLLPIVLSLLYLTFVYYDFQFGSFFTYFKYNGQAIPLKLFEIFKNYSATGTMHSSELYLIFYIIYGLGIAQIYKHKEIFWYSLAYYLFVLFVWHDDISRYMLPLAPYALVVGADSFLSKPRAKLLLLFIPLVYIYCKGMIPYNVMGVEQWNFVLTK
jgi:Gpi18-like mannosyltransferase